jgi:PTS system ascorbate-specific IIA component
MVLWSGVVLLHAHPQDGVRYLSLSLVTFELAVPFGHETNDPVDVAIALGAVDGEAHLRALMQMHAMLTDAEAMEAIRRATDKREVLGIVAAFSNS